MKYSLLLAISILGVISNCSAQLTLSPLLGNEWLIIDEAKEVRDGTQGEFFINETPFADNSVFIGLQAAKRLTDKFELFFSLNYVLRKYELPGSYGCGVVGCNDLISFNTYRLTLGGKIMFSSRFSFGLGPSITFVDNNYIRLKWTGGESTRIQLNDGRLLGLTATVSYTIINFHPFFSVDKGLFYLEGSSSNGTNAFSAFRIGMAYSFEL